MLQLVHDANFQLYLLRHVLLLHLLLVKHFDRHLFVGLHIFRQLYSTHQQPRAHSLTFLTILRPVFSV